MNSNRERIKSLQALRAIAFLGIFFTHAEFFISWSAFGVSIFYVLSGFLMMYHYDNTEMDLSVGSCFRFAINKIKTLYPLHIVTMILAAILSIAVFLAHGDGIKSYMELALKIVLNVFLLQSWVPDISVNISLNGVAWYLSSALFLYFMFPYIAALVRKTRFKILALCCAAVLVVEIIGCVLFISFFGSSGFAYVWFMYFFPIFRLGDFFAGCCLGRIYSHRPADSEMSVLKYSILEILAAAITAGVFWWLGQGHTDIIHTALHNLTTIYIPISVLWVYLFTVNKGIITILLSRRMLIRLGNISGYIFLIHYIVILYINNLINFLDIELSEQQRAGAAVLELGISIIATLVYIPIEKKIKDRFSARAVNSRAH